MITILRILSFLLLFIPLVSFAQMQIDGQVKYGNEWIDYDQTYFKFKTGEEGIYRLSYAELNAAGVFSTGTTPTGAHLQLFRMGKEVPIFVTTTGTMGGSDYLEFFATQNDSDLDKHLYDSESDIPNPKKSLFTDNASYFLTWNTSTSNQRVAGIANNLSGLPGLEAYCMVTDSKSFDEVLSRGVNYGSSDNWKCEYDLGEGFLKRDFLATQSFSFATPQAYTAGPDAKISSRIVSKSGSHLIAVEINGTSLLNQTYSSWTVKALSANFSSTSLTSSTNLTINGTSNEDDKFHVGYLDLTYPHTFDFENKGYQRFTVAPNSAGNYLEITNFNHGGQAPLIFDLTNNLRLVTTLSGSTVRVFLPASSDERELAIIIDGAQKSVMDLNKRDLVDYGINAGTDVFDYIILTHKDLMDDGSGHNYIEDYVDYRSSVSGGSYSVKAVEVTQIYDQFGYGIDRHEISTRNFLRLAKDNWQAKMLNIIGKGVDYRIMRQTPTGNMSQFDLVPSFGNPNSDHLLVTNQGSISPNLAVGRISAKNANQVRIYLDKIKEHEQAQLITPQTIEDKAWMKKILHFGGGDAGIQNLIKGELNDLAEDIETAKFGADVKSFFKQSTDVVTNAADEDVVDLINQGASMLTFFGHSAPSTLDFDLGDPNNYANSGKYPLFYAIGCGTNRMFETENTLSEDFVFIENKGCIGFFGATWITALSSLSQYAKYFYENLGEEHYGETLGEVIKATIEDYNFTNSYTASLLRNALILQGDPAIKMYPHAAPDYLTNVQASSVEPSIVNAQEETFILKLNVANLGFANVDSIDVKIQQEIPSGEVRDLLVKRIATPYYETEVPITLPLNGEGALGRNNLIVTVDVNDIAEELPAAAEMNNVSRVPFYVVANDIFPVSPAEFSIVPNNNLTLKASTANAFSSPIKYFLEIDTTELFDSPLKEATQITQEGGLVEWSPNIPMVNERVYYWRVSVDSTIIAGSGFNWHGSSFTYVDGSPSGWNQGHFYQFEKDAYNGMSAENVVGAIFDFTKRFYDFRKNHSAVNVVPWVDNVLFRDGFRISSYYPCPPSNGHKSIWVFAFDPETTEFGTPAPGTPAYNCFTDAIHFSFQQANTAAGRAKTMEFIEDVVPDGYYVTFFTHQLTTNDYHADEWAADSISYGKNIFQVLENQGVSGIRRLETGQYPYFCVFKKNEAEEFSPLEFYATVVEEKLDIQFQLEGKTDRGSFSSTLIGPSTNWRSLEWQLSDYDVATEDANVDIYGVDANGNETLIHGEIRSLDTTLQHISAIDYPYLRLKYNALDSLNRTPAQLDHWRVLFDPVPEAAIAPNKLFVFQSDTLQQGQALHLEIAVENIGIADMDSLLVNYTVTDASNNELLTAKRMAPLLQGETLTAILDLPTANLFGDNQLLIDVNPNNDQAELTHFNNVGLKTFHIVGDGRNPLLDVTFDGVRIMDGDIVSAKPGIDISLTDENLYLALDDTSLLRVFIIFPDTEDEIEYPVDSDILTFIPATIGGTEGNRAKMEFRPDFEIDGTYQLIVRGRDKSGNKSGSTDYKVYFEIINETMVSNVLNYPNPFSTSTQFVFTLTGDALPDFMKIQIMTVGGKIVREVTMDELGSVRIGNNKSDFKWNGTDEYGDKLANGVYLYRVVTKKDGEEYEVYETNTNQYFKNGFGKMMILR